MKGSKMRIEDVMTLKFDSSNIKVIRDDYMGAFKQPKPGMPHPSGLGLVPGSEGQSPQSQEATTQSRGLLVRIAATHSGLITRNNGFYLPDKMRAGAGTWTEIYPKPIQVHHEDKVDPIGRVISARYVDTVSVVADRFHNSVLHDSMGRDIGIADAKFWQDFTDSKVSFMRKVDMIQMMDSILDDPHYTGTGYIELTADITDPDAIQKIVDGRYLTGSVGANTDKAVCSICKTDWLEDGQCDHRPGRDYEGKRMFIVAGNIAYDEYSFVNRPADRHSGVLEINSGNIRNSVESEARDSARYQSEIRLNDKLEDGSMTIANTTAGATEEKKDDSVETPAVSETPANVTDATTEQKDPITVILDKLLSDKPEITAEEALALYDALELENKLSAEQLSKLPKSSFCGPCRTFPVTDEAHYKAVAKFYSKNVLSGTDVAKRFGDAVERKRKALGFVQWAPVADKVEETVTETPVVEDKEQKKLNISISIEAGEASDTEKLGLAKELIAQLVGSLGQDSVAKATVEAGLALDPTVEDALVDEVAKYESRVGALTDELSLLRRELASLLTDVANLEDQLIDSKTSNRQLKAAHVHVLGSLKDAAVKTSVDELSKLSDEVLDGTLKTLSTEFDIQKITDSLNTGLSKTPDVKVEPPAGETEPSTEPAMPTKASPTYANKAMIDEVYRRLLVVEDKPEKARAFMNDMIRQGYYPASKSE